MREAEGERWCVMRNFHLPIVRNKCSKVTFASVRNRISAGKKRRTTVYPKDVPRNRKCNKNVTQRTNKKQPDDDDDDEEDEHARSAYQHKPTVHGTAATTTKNEIILNKIYPLHGRVSAHQANEYVVYYVAAVIFGHCSR